MSTSEGVRVLAWGSSSSDLGAGLGEPVEALSLLAVGPTFSEALDFFLEVEYSALAGALASVLPCWNSPFHLRRAAWKSGLPEVLED